MSETLATLAVVVGLVLAFEAVSHLTLFDICIGALRLFFGGIQ